MDLGILMNLQQWFITFAVY